MENRLRKFEARPCTPYKAARGEQENEGCKMCPHGEKGTSQPLGYPIDFFLSRPVDMLKSKDNSNPRGTHITYSTVENFCQAYYKFRNN